MLNESLKDISTMCFHVIFQAIMDSFELETLAPDGGSRRDVKILMARCREESDRFINSSEFDTMVQLASIHYKVPSPCKVRERLRNFKQTRETLDLSQLIHQGRN